VCEEVENGERAVMRMVLAVILALAFLGILVLRLFCHFDWFCYVLFSNGENRGCENPAWTVSGKDQS
jgi:hypothetical protein